MDVPTLPTTTPAATTSRWSPAARRRAGHYLFLLPAVLYILATMVYPVVDNIRLSVHDVTVMSLLSGDAPYVGLENYRKLFADPAFRNAAGLSVLFTAGSLAFQFTIGFALALFFNRPFPGNGLLRALMLLAWLLPTVVSASLFRWMLDGDFGVLNFALLRLGLIDHARYWLLEPQTALWGTVLANVWIGVPFNMVLLLAGLQGIPPTLYEAASVDGANGAQRFRSLTLPLMRPVALSVLLLALTLAVNALFTAVQQRKR